MTVKVPELWWRSRSGTTHLGMILGRNLGGSQSFLVCRLLRRCLRITRGKQRSTEGLSAKAAWLPATRGLRDWRKDLSTRDQQLFEAIAGDELEMLGFERLHASIPGEVRETARGCEDWWRSEMSDRTGVKTP